MTEKERSAALLNYTPKKPRKQELGGDFYYKCHWISCNEDITKWFNYCPKCGQRIDWSDE